MNRRRLEALLAKAKIRYIYIPELAPPARLLAIQFRVDRVNGETPRTRTHLAPMYARAYERAVLARYDVDDFAAAVGDAKIVALFCVETEPAACHRSLVARELGARVTHLKPR